MYMDFEANVKNDLLLYYSFDTHFAIILLLATCSYLDSLCLATLCLL